MSSTQLEKARSVFGDVVLDEDDASLAYSNSLNSSRAESSVDGLASISYSSTLTSMKTMNLSKEETKSAIMDSSTHNSSFDPKSAEKENAPSPWLAKSVLSGKETGKNDQFQRRSKRFDKDRVNRTKAAIQRATTSINAANSVNPTINAARKAKEEILRRKLKETKQFREEWEQDKEEAEAFLGQSEKLRLQLLQIQQSLSSHNSRSKAQAAHARRLERLQRIEQESLFKSSVYRDHQKALLEQRQNRRRQSLALRSLLRENQKVGEEKLRLQRSQEDEVLHEERREASIMNMKAKRELAENRRKSFAFRNGDARRIRMLHAQLEADRIKKEAESIQLGLAAKSDVDAERRRMEEERRQSLAHRNEHARLTREKEKVLKYQAMANEHEYFESKWAAEKDVENYCRRMEEERRLSLANRGVKSRSSRDEASKQRSELLAAQHDSYELKWAAEEDAKEYRAKMERQNREDLALSLKEARRGREVLLEQHQKAIAAESESIQLKLQAAMDADAYQREMDAQRRQSIARRNAYAREQRHREAQNRSAMAEEEHKSYELKWAAEKDVEAYKRQEEKERRDSFAWRNQEAARHAQVMRELEALAREKEREDMVLKWAGEEDAKKYLASLAEERRKSLLLRGEISKQHREIEQEAHEKEIQRRAEDEKWNSGARKDIEEYKRQCAARDRTSLQFRGKEAHVRRIQTKDQQLREQLMEHANFELESLARHDIEAYVHECKQRRRMSLALRAKEKIRHFQWKAEKSEEDRQVYSREVRARLADQRSVELARREERARRALEAIKHSGCSFNPFSNVLI